MPTRLIIDGNAVYEIDEDCLECQKGKKNFREGKNAGSCRKREKKEEEKAGPENKSPEA